jgi:adenylate cyclase
MNREHSPKPSFTDKTAIERQLETMLASPDFKTTPQQTALLRYVVSQTLAGKADRIKGYTVATEVLGRGSDFNQSIDPIVSIQAAQLRRSMAHYYLASGQHDPVHIDIPKGTYVPRFKTRADDRLADSAIGRAKLDTRGKGAWPSVHVRPLRNLSGDANFNVWCEGMAMEIACELNRYPDIRVVSPGAFHPVAGNDRSAARFVIDGIVRRDNTCIKLNFELTDIRSGRQIWSHSHQTSHKAVTRIAFQEDIARGVAVNVAGKCGWIARTLDQEAKRHAPGYSQAYEAVLRYYEYELTARPETLMQALTTLEKAIAFESEHGQLWSMRAKLLADIHAFDILGFDRSLDQALTLAHKGIRLMPNDQRARVIMAYVYLLHGDLDAGLATAEQALQLGPETFFELDSIGYVMTLLGNWELGPAQIEKAIRVNPFYCNGVHYALWVNHLRQEGYDQAWQETLKLNRPAQFWDPLAKCATLGLLGRTEEGRRVSAQLLSLKPDFLERGRRLIRHCIKFDDISERVIAGLRAAGVEVA